MNPSGRLARAFRRELRRLATWRFAHVLGRLLQAAGLLLLGAVALQAALGAHPLPVLAWGWALALPAALAAALLAARPGRAARREAARAWDRRLQAHGAVLAATHLAGGSRQGSLLEPLVLRDAMRALEAAPREAPVRPSGRPLALAILLAVLAFVGGSGAFGGAGRGRNPGSGQGAGDFADEGSAAERAEQEAEPGSSRGPGAATLEDLAVLEVRTRHRVLMLGEPVELVVTLKARGERDEELPLRIQVGVADGMPVPDQGLGPGFRVLQLPEPLELPREPGSGASRTLDLAPFMESWGIYGTGIFTLEARGGAADPERRDLGVVRGNRWSFQISENRRRHAVRKPEPVTASRPVQVPRKRPDPETSRAGRGGEPPEGGPPERLPGVPRRPAAVKPLLGDGPSVEKEVEVFERERGGGQPPAGTPSREHADLPRPVFTRKPENPVPALTYAPGERRLIREYFEALDRGR